MVLWDFCYLHYVSVCEKKSSKYRLVCGKPHSREVEQQCKRRTSSSYLQCSVKSTVLFRYSGIFNSHCCWLIQLRVDKCAVLNQSNPIWSCNRNKRKPQPVKRNRQTAVWSQVHGIITTGGAADTVGFHHWTHHNTEWSRTDDHSTGHSSPSLIRLWSSPTSVMSLTCLPLKLVLQCYLHHSRSHFTVKIRWIQFCFFHCETHFYWQKSVQKWCFARRLTACTHTWKWGSFYW